ncbi:hypothetical protein Y032_0062g3323 [Ancylostoma ceylanicum]|nr:hypothetical protein Y032_0062g3323 [Ancylostoma ceylanicum]
MLQCAHLQCDDHSEGICPGVEVALHIRARPDPFQPFKFLVERLRASGFWQFARSLCLQLHQLSLHTAVDTEPSNAILVSATPVNAIDLACYEWSRLMYHLVYGMLYSVGEKVSESAPLGQLILPETLKLLPLFVNSIVKNDAINGGSEMTVDDKVWMIELIRGMRVDHAMLLLYPKIVPVDHLELQDPSEMTTVTGSVRASYENLNHTKAYLIDNGIVLFLWIGLGVAEAWVQDIFGVNSIAMLDTENAQIPEKDNARSRGLRRAVELLQEVGPRKRKLFVVREKDALEPWMKKFLVEDRSGPNVMSYVDFLCYIHREIRNILS